VHKYNYKLFRERLFSSVHRYLSMKEYVKLDMVHACNNSNLAITFKHGQVLFKFDVHRLVNKYD
jgi:hypothetical protein